MLNALRRLFTDLVERGEAAAFAVDDPRLAVAALMWHVIGADGVIQPNERERMLGELERRYRLAADDAHDLAEAARRAELESAALQTFTAGLQRRLPIAERREIVSSLWRLAFTDGDVHEFEDNVVWRIAELLGIEAHERTALRKEVEAAAADEALRMAEARREGVGEGS
ncbi:MAG: TerB family tellurite resistance protein [Hyphomicrobiales bacterium]|nr:TerB family tellurite resistance protein [Hyphomicrobiales bacterium]